MYLTGYKKLIVALLLLVFTSQSIAALAMSCQLNSLVQPSIEQTMMEGMDYSMMAMDDSMSMMDMQSMPSKGDQTSDCCKAMGHCSMGNCSFLGVSNTLVVSFTAFNSISPDSFLNIQPDPLISSLYRPPIFR